MGRAYSNRWWSQIDGFRRRDVTKVNNLRFCSIHYTAIVHRWVVEFCGMSTAQPILCHTPPSQSKTSSSKDIFLCSASVGREISLSNDNWLGEGFKFVSCTSTRVWLVNLYSLAHLSELTWWETVLPWLVHCDWWWTEGCRLGGPLTVVYTHRFLCRHLWSSWISLFDPHGM